VTKLQAFQEATVEAAVNALSNLEGSRRFLVADEVGLGKTVVARAIAERLKRPGKSFNIFYLCPSLEIAAQNRDKFGALTGLDRAEQLSGADRLSLSISSPPPIGNGFRIFSLTPETSLPSWKPGARTGRKLERTLIWNLVRQSYPDLTQKLRGLDRDRNKSRPMFESSNEDVSSLARSFDQGLRAVFDCANAPLESRIISWLDTSKDILEFVSRGRSALVFAALSRKVTSPDLLILDEFHRYADLIIPTSTRASNKPLAAERKRVHDLLIAHLLNGRDGQPPATLLLSATPYKLSRLDGSQINPGDRYGSLINLVAYLYGVNGSDVARKTTALIKEYHQALISRTDRTQITARIGSAKSKLEVILRPVVARTERALALKDDLFVRRTIPTAVKTADIEIFRHLARSIAEKDRHLRSWTTPLWSSVPYPAQTLHGYAVWKALSKAPRARVTIDNSRTDPAHPQYRAFSSSVVDAESLQLPWLKPSLPWWKLEGAWKATEEGAGKILLFSKFRAVPTSLSALLSMPVDEISLGSKSNQRAKGKAQSYLRPGVGLNHALLAMFAPWPSLSLAIEPKKDAEVGIASIQRDATRQLRQWIEERGITIRNGPSRKLWKLALGLETSGRPQAAKQLTRAFEVPALQITLKAWSTPPKIEHISVAELKRLAVFLLSAPGAVLARSFHRHEISFFESSESLDERVMRQIFRLCWTNLRTYLGQRYFRRVILGRSGKGRYPESLMTAILKGGLEAALDEQLALLRVLGDKRDAELVNELVNGLLDRPGLVRIRRRGIDTTVRVHAAVPFAGGERRGGGHDRKDEKLRSDTLRRAFNSPFWPHVLSTTSVGQEGLDFHYWCDKIVHWDLPVGPVEFEQREGRISRYSSLTVRRAFVTQHAAAAYTAPPGKSPFNQLFDAAHKAEDDGIGLEKWWTPPTEKPTSFTFDWNFSIRKSRLDKLKTELMYYRLGIGQPDPEAFIELLKHLEATRDVARGLALNLSPSSGAA
jgi:hypothetical protein